jgi:2-keto-4-pentenoate hydratase/2-oxohepta-3-ene-1,7-dioic acid hydratase in catechol pathway
MVSSEQVRRIVRVSVGGRPKWGVVRDQMVFELSAGPFAERPEIGPEVGRLEGQQLLAPATPSKIVCIGRNYAAHAAEHGAEVPTEPALFLKPPSSVLGPGAAIVLPAQSQQVEHEGELALVIGRRCRGVASSDAWQHVLGVTCGNDVTARDLQRSDVQWTRGKGFDTFCPLGPWLVAGLGAAEVDDLEIRCRVNGELRQQGRTSQMVFSPSELIAYISAVMTLEPGDVILTGTPAGVGPLGHGDEVEVEVEAVGVLANPVRSAGSDG